MHRRSVTHRPAPRYTGGESPLPAPDGWFCLGLSREIKRGKAVSRRLAGQELVVYRTRDGLLCVRRAYCPHLGAHLGAGGTVAGDDIVCPFHGFAFGIDGACVRTGYGTRPPKIHLVELPACEPDGLIMVWHHHAGEPPSWHIPDRSFNGDCPPVASLSEFAGHPQEVTENFFDTGHLQILHSRWIARAEARGQTENGPSAHLTLRMHFRVPVLRLRRTEDYKVDVHGLGFQVVDINLPGGITIRNWITTTPIDPWRVHLRLIASARVSAPAVLPPAAGRLFRAAFSRLLARFVLWLHTEQFVRAAEGDLRVWRSKEYLTRPRLAEGDGKITRFRRWAAQFYPAYPGVPVTKAEGGAAVAPAEGSPVLNPMPPRQRTA